ncbi:guanylate kinase [bacterium F11]|nr:guanylate kinase [bacterium F11]
MKIETKSVNKLPKGLPIVLSAPSGGGKTTLADHLLKKKGSKLIRSISCTTRAPRAGEKDGVDYYFIGEKEFKRRIDDGEFLEWAMVHNYMYGTPIQAITEDLTKGNDVLLVIDPQGGVSVRKIYPHGIFIFVVPPTWEDLKKRLKKRGQDKPKDMKVRIENASKELEYLTLYDYLVVNQNLKKAVAEVEAIIQAEHLHLTRWETSDVPFLKK